MILQLLIPTASCLITAVWSLLHRCMLLMIMQLLMPTASCLITAVWSLLHRCIDVIDDFATTDANDIVSDHSCLKFTAQMHWCYWWFCNYWCQRHRVWSLLFEVYRTNALMLLMILQQLMPTASCLIIVVWSLPHKCIDVIDDFATTDANDIVSDPCCLKFTAQMHWCYWWFCNY